MLMNVPLEPTIVTPMPRVPTHMVVLLVLVTRVSAEMETPAQVREDPLLFLFTLYFKLHP